jgi:hypothetical protein
VVNFIFWQLHLQGENIGIAPHPGCTW